MSERKIKICHVVDHITALADGRFTHLRMIFNNLDKEKYSHLLIYEGGEEIKKRLNKSNVIVYKLKSFGNKLPFKSLIEIYRIIKKERVDLLHSHSTKAYILLGLLSILLRKKHIYNYHGVFIFNEYYNKLQRITLYTFHNFIYFFKGCEIAIAPSKSSLKILFNDSKLFKKSDFYYNSIVDTALNISNPEISYSLKEIKKKNFLVGMIGRIDSEKRVDIALMVLKSIINKKVEDIHFIFIGDGGLLNEIKNLAILLKLEKNLTFLGYVENPIQLISLLDVLLITSEREGLPLTIWEAMSAEVPIISSDVGGIKEIIEGENCGFVYQFGDIDTCASLILKLKSDRELRKSLGMNGKKAMESKFTKTKFINFFEELYNSLVKK